MPSVSDGHWSCTGCPAETSIAEEGHGINERFTVDAARLGHFSDRLRNQALLESSACEYHASGSKGTFLLTETNGQWQFTSYTKGLSVFECHTFHRRDGLDLLLCEGNWGNSSSGGQNLYEVDFSRGGEPEKDLVSTYQTLSCGDTQFWQESAINVRVENHRVVVRATYGRRQVTPEQCVAFETQSEILPLETFTIVLQFDGLNFKIVSGKRFVARLSRET